MVAKNMGKIDKVLRIVIGLGLLAFAVTTGNWIGYIGIIPIVTALIGWCPLYSILKIDTGCTENCENPKK